MYVVTAKVEAWEEDFPGSRVKWVVGQSREVHDSLVDKFRNNPAAWTVSGGADASPMLVTKGVTGGIGIIGPDGKQVAGTASPYAFTTRDLAETDNGQTRICASAQVAMVNPGMPVGFGVPFKGEISFTAGSGVTIADVRTTGAANPWCALIQTGVDTYDVVGTKA